MTRGARARLALVALALVAILFVFVFPTRSYLAQRRQVSNAQHDVDVLRDQNNQLEALATHLQSRSAIEGMARDQFHRVYPGEQVYETVPAETTTPGVTTTTVP
jgi:cell division protein FtsB